MPPARTLERAVRELAAHPEVLAVFWGWRHKDGAWRSELALSAHVRRKDPSARGKRRIPRALHGIPVDVLPVGAVRTHSSLDTADFVRARSANGTRRSAVSAFTRGPKGVVLALLSGHGTIPSTDGVFATGPWSPSDAPWVQLVDDDGTFRLIELADGSVSGTLDFAVGSLPGLSGDDVVLGHVMAPAPIVVRPTPLTLGEQVYQLSPVRRRTVVGRYVQHHIGSHVAGATVSAEDAEAGAVSYDDVLLIQPVAGEPMFSVQGDSGSLVFDGQRRAVGVVVAGTESGIASYVLPMNRELAARLGSLFDLFFEGSVS